MSQHAHIINIHSVYDHIRRTILFKQINKKIRTGNERRKKAVKDQHQFLNCQKWSKRNGKRVAIASAESPGESLCLLCTPGTKFAFQSAQAAEKRRETRQNE